MVLLQSCADLVGTYLRVLAMMKRSRGGARKPSPGFMRAVARTDTSLVSEALYKQARKSGQLNLSNRSLEVVPPGVWHINTEVPPDQDGSFTAQDDERWWDQVDLTKLILAANQIKEIPDDVRLLTALTILDIHSNQLSSLPEAIGELQQLKRLALSHNELSSLPATLTSLPSLQLLKLDHNKLSSLPEDLGSLEHVEELDISHNLLSRLPPSLGDMRSLHILAVTDNSLETIPDTIGSLAGLKQLSLSKNKLTSLPELTRAVALEMLYCNYNILTKLPLLPAGSGLKELHCGYNRISGIDPERLSRMQSLIYLDLRDNKISNVPESIVEVTTLERLDLSNNDLSGLPYAMGNMANFKSLLLEGNPLRGLRREIVQRGTVGILKYLKSRIQTEDTTETVHNTTKFTPTKLKPQAAAMEGLGKDVASFSLDSKAVDISKKSLTEIPDELYSNVNLVTLNVGYNKLSALSPKFATFTSLTVLDIRNNRISELPQELQACSKLTDAILSCNAFLEVPPVLYSLKSLETILANDNRIGSIDVDGLLQLPQLACLDLQNNSISQVPPRLGTVTTLKHLQLGGNPFRIPRAAILAKGTGPLLEYLRDRIPS